jgi:hypothetical protein
MRSFRLRIAEGKPHAKPAARNFEVFQCGIRGSCVEQLKWLKHVRHPLLALRGQIERGGPRVRGRA